MKAWIIKFLIYALIPLFFFIQECFADTYVTSITREMESEEPQVIEEEACLGFPCVEECRRSVRWIIEGHVSGFWPQDKVLRKIFGGWWADYQFLIGYHFTSRWSLLALGGYREKTGHALNFPTKTKVREVPVTLEVRYNYMCRPCWKLYLGVGPSTLFFKETLYLPRAKKHNSKEAWGGCVEMGSLINIYKAVVLDLFVGYSYYVKEHFSSAVENGSGANLKLGGFQAGLGLGYQF